MQGNPMSVTDFEGFESWYAHQQSLRLVFTPEERRALCPHGNSGDIVQRYYTADDYARPSIEWTIMRVLVGRGLRKPDQLYAEHGTGK
jgi:hypothetical protein